eukprot:scaffold107794_cov65-Attheya_sp.AAC.1
MSKVLRSANASSRGHTVTARTFYRHRKSRWASFTIFKIARELFYPVFQMQPHKVPTMRRIKMPMMP